MMSIRRKHSAGFTLLELSVVILIIGTLGLVLGPGVVGSTTNVKATQIQRLADTAANNWFYLTMQAGTGSAVQSNQRFYSSSSAASPPGPNWVLFVGRDHVSPQYVSAYDRSGVRALDRLVAQVGSTSQFTVVNMPGSTVNVTGGGKNPLLVTFGNIPSEVVLELVRRSRPGAALVTGTATTVAQMTYNCPSAGANCTSVVFSRRP